MGPDHFHPIQNSEVYVLNKKSIPHAHSHSAPPSPPTPCETRSLSPVLDSPLLTPDSKESSAPATLSRLAKAVHVLTTEATALSHLTRLYETNPVARAGFDASVETITKCMSRRGKIVICGVGKSGHIAKKLVATMISLKIAATFLHPTEALHGDLGKVGDHDVILLITFSGRTPELLTLLPHFDAKLPLMIITSHVQRETCAIIDARPDAILLPAPIHESETRSFGVSAPTTSTTIALALGDALAVTISDELHPSVAEVFGRNHPGGAIGATYQGPQKLRELAVSFDDMPDVRRVGEQIKAVHVIMAGYQSASGWVKFGNEGVASPRRIKRLRPEQMDCPATHVKNLILPSGKSITMQADMNVQEACQLIREERDESANCFEDDDILAVVEGATCIGLIEVGTLLQLGA